MNNWTRSAPADKAYILGPEQHVYHLVRAAAADNSTAFPWLVTVQKKVTPGPGLPGVHAVKGTSCAKFKSSLGASFCCVNKKVTGTVPDIPGISKKTQSALISQALVNI